jgi:hypothetical protein
VPSIIDQLLGADKTSGQDEYVSCGEVHTLWADLAMRYDVKEMTDLFLSCANDTEFKALLAAGKKTLEEQIGLLEKELTALGVPLPPAPPKTVSLPDGREVLRDEWMFRTVYMGIQSFIDEHSRCLRDMMSPHLRQMFIVMQRNEVNEYDKLTEYGKFKGWLRVPPPYRPVGQ